jgi:hypothetical protein
MSAVRELLRRAAQRRRCWCARLPWEELEAEAERQGCSAADVFFDWAGRTVIRSPATGLRPQQSFPSQADGSTL